MSPPHHSPETLCRRARQALERARAALACRADPAGEADLGRALEDLDRYLTELDTWSARGPGEPDAASWPAVWLDGALHIVGANREAIDLLGRAAGDLGTELPVQRLFAAASRPRLQAVLRELSDAVAGHADRPRRRGEAGAELIVLIPSPQSLQRQLNELAEALPGVLYTFRQRPDGSFHCPYISARVREIFGADPRDLARDAAPLFDRIVAEDREAVVASVVESARTLTPWQGEFRLAHPARGQVWIQAQSTPLAEADGGVVWHGFLFDITERKQAERRLKLSEFALERASDAVYWIRPDGSFFYVNEAACQMLGYSREELAGLGVFDLNESVRDEAWREHWASLREHGRVRLETTHRCRSGHRIEVEVSANLLTFEGLEFNCALARDLTERKRNEQSLRQHAYLLEAAQETARLGYYVTDLNTGRWTSSTMLDEIMGIDAGYDRTVEGWGRLVHPDDRNRALEEFRVAMDRREALHHQYRLVRPRDGRVIWADARGTLEDEDGQPVRLIGTVYDITERKETELALERHRQELERRVRERTRELAMSEERLRLALEASNEGLWDWNLATDETYCSPAYFRMLGHEPEEVVANRRGVFLDLIHPDDERWVMDHVAERIVAPGQFQVEFRMRHRSGGYRWILSQGHVVARGAAGEPLRAVGTHTDITERREAEQALVESETRFREMADNAPVLIWMSGLDRLCHYFNKIWLDFTGRGLEQELGNGWAEGVHPDDFDACLKTYVESFDARRPFRMDYRLRRHDGEFRWIQDEGHPRHDGQGRFLGYIGSCIDITERKQAEQSFQVMVEASPYALALVSQGGTIERANPKLESLFGYAPGELAGRAIEDLVPAGQRQRHVSERAVYQDQADPGPRQMGRERFVVGQRRDGSSFRAEVGLSPLTLDGRRYVICAVVDITERKRAEQQIRELNANLERKVAERTAQLAAASAAKSQFLAHMSHEIRTPMNAILGFTQILERERMLPGQADMVQKISESGRSLLHIINDILDFSKIEAGQLRIDAQPFEPEAVVSRIDNLLRASAGQKGLRLVRALPALPLGRRVGDPLRLEQVLLNLVSNAIKFTERGEVSVTLRAVADTAGAALRFEVRDTGIGIAPGVLANLFQPFSQADASITRRFGGTGLGLAISKRLVELMGGQLGVTSEPGRGSRFWFEVPLGDDVKPGAAAAPAAAPAKPVGLAGLRVLAVDDNRINLLLVERALTRDGCRVDLAADGQQALKILEARPDDFDVVLMDVQMPVMDGLTATRLLRENPLLADLPVIALTAGVLAEEREAALRAGVDDFLAKPVELRQLNAMLGRYAAGRVPPARGAGG